MIIECNGRTTEEKLKSLQESVQRALNDAGSGGSSSSLGTIYIGVNGKIQGVIDGKYVNIKNLNANNITTGDLNAQRIQAAFVDAQGGKIIDFETESINGHHILDGTVVADALDNAVVTLFTDTSVYYSGEEPTGTTAKPLKDGDIWYKSVDEDESRVEYYYVYDAENEEWVEKTLDASMFTAGTITAREIASGTITASQLAANTISANELTIGLNTTINNKAEQSALDATNITVATKANQTALDATNTTVATLQQIVDNTIETWFYSGVPTLNNLPASGWTTDVEKDRHLGDLYYDNATGYAYRFLYNDSTDVYFWQQLSDSAVAEALSKANAAQSTANSKKRVFIAEPTTPYEVGDLWCNTSGDTKVCTTARATGSYVSTDWVKSSNYTDDTLASAVQTNLANNYTNTTGMNTAINNHHDDTKYDADNPNGYTDDTLALSVDSRVSGTVTYFYTHSGTTETVYKREDGTYYYLSGSTEIDVSYNQLDIDPDTNLPATGRDDNGISQSLTDTQETINAISTEVSRQAGIISEQLTGNAQHPTGSIREAILTNSLLNRGYAVIDETGIWLRDLSNGDKSKMLLNSVGMNLLFNDIAVAQVAIFEGQGTMLSNMAMFSTLKIRSEEDSNGVRHGRFAWVGQSNGHLSLKEVRD